MSLLKVEKINKTYTSPDGTLSILADVDISLSAGGIHAIVGPSGCGKSTFLLICGALLHPDNGSVTIGDANLIGLDANKRARKRAGLVGYVFQQFYLIPYLSVEKNIMAAALASNGQDAKERCAKLIDNLGLSHRRHHVPGKLSAGEQQRVALARALLNEPKILIADEPTGNLDPENGKKVLSVMEEYAKQGGLVLMATHSKEVAEFADETYTFKEGKLERLAG